MVPHHLHRVKSLYISHVMIIIEVIHLYMRFIPGTHFFFPEKSAQCSWLCHQIYRMQSKKQKTEKKATTHIVTMPKQSHQKAMLFLLLFVCLVTQRVQLFETTWTIAHQALLSMGFSMDRKYWSGLPFPSPGDLSDQGSNTNLQHWQLASLSLSHRGSQLLLVTIPVYCFLLSIHTQRPLVYCWSQEVLQLLLYYQ